MAAEKSAVTYFVAGKANDDSFAKAEHLAEVLMSSLPSATCHVLPTLPDAWPALSKSTCARLGCKEVHPLVWTGSGRMVGSLVEFERECLAKYNLKVEASIRPSQWSKIAEENAAHAATLAASGATGALIPEGAGAGRGARISEALLDGHRRFLGTDPPGPPPPCAAARPPAARRPLWRTSTPLLGHGGSDPRAARTTHAALSPRLGRPFCRLSPLTQPRPPPSSHRLPPTRRAATTGRARPILSTQRSCSSRRSPRG